MNFTFLRIFKIVRLFRVLRIVRIFRFFRELRIILLSLVSSVMSLFWTMVLLLTTIFIFSVFFDILVAEHIGDGGSGVDALQVQFTSLPHTMRKLLQAVTGGQDWEEIADSLVHVSVACMLVFLFYICLMIFAI